MKVFDPKVVEYVPEEGSEVGKDLVSRVTQRFATELDQGKLHNSRFIAESTLLTDSSLQNKLVTKTEEDEVRSLFHNASVNTIIDTFVKRKYAASRINLGYYIVSRMLEEERSTPRLAGSGVEVFGYQPPRLVFLRPRRLCATFGANILLPLGQDDEY